MSQSDPVVPMFAPNNSARLSEKVSNPALTRPMAVIVVALDDRTISVTKAPQNAPDNRVSVVRRPESASALRPLGHAEQGTNRPTPPRTEIVVDIRAPRKLLRLSVFSM